MVNTRSINYLYIFICIFFTACTTVPKPDTEKSPPVVDRSVSEEEIKSEQIRQEREVQPVQAEEIQVPETKLEEEINTPRADVKKNESPVIIALLDDVTDYENSGNSQQAEATLERAIRIEPKNPLLWHRLGLLQLREKQWQQAIAMAQKSNSLAANNTDLQLNNWKIIAQASKEMGDDDLLALARKKIFQLGK